MNTTLTNQEIKETVDNAIQAMEEFTSMMGVDGLANEGLPALWGDGDNEYEVTRGPKCEMTVFDPNGDAIARVIAELDPDGSFRDVEVWHYVGDPEAL